ncbi:MAG: hypothetical protein AAF598_02585 [Bacteroidota bacterium]
MDKNLHELLIQYLDNQLSGKDRQYIDQQLEQDPEWGISLELLTQLRSSAKAEVGAAIRQQLDRELAQQPSKLKWLRPAIGIAVSLLLLLAFWWMIQTPTSPTSLFADTFEAPKASMARTADQTDQLNALLEAFNKGQYEPILNQGPRLLELEKFDHRQALTFYLGIAQLQNHQETLALETFAKVDPESNFHYDAGWFRSLAYLSLGKTAEAAAQLKRLPDNYLSPNGIAPKTVLKQLK